MTLYEELKNISNISNPSETFSMLQYVTHNLLADYIEDDSFQVVRVSDTCYRATGWHANNAIDDRGRTWTINIDPVLGVGYEFTPPTGITGTQQIITLQGDSGFQTLPDSLKAIAIAYDETTGGMQLNSDRVQAESVADVHVTYTTKQDSSLSDQIKYIYSHYGYTLRRFNQPYDNTTSLYIIQDVRD